MLNTAINYLESGLCVLPALRAEKRPSVRRWKHYTERLPTKQKVQAWFANADAMCILCGAVSGHLEMIDFDFEGELYEEWCRLVANQSAELLGRLVIERSQSGGRHVVYRSAVAVSGSRRLAQRKVMVPGPEPLELAGKRYVPRKVASQYEITLTLIETRGEGALFLCDPTPGYVIEQGSLCDLPVLSEAERDQLLETAWMLNEVAPPTAPIPSTAAGIGRPGDDYNARGDVAELLRRHGWVLVRDGENQHWRRPGKQHGCSATLRGGVFYVFSSNAAPFEPERGYAPFHVYSLLEHAGDFVEAARALRQSGYGDQLPAMDTGVDLSGICGGSTAITPHRDNVPPRDPGAIPEELLRVPGFISEVMDECLTTAPYPNPIMAFCGALALQAFLAGRKVRDPGDNRTNLYLLGLAHSSAGKDWPRKINTRILYEMGLTSCLGERFASGEAIQDSLLRSPNILFQTDEIDGILQSINKSQDARYESMMSTLLTIYSSASTVFPIRRKAGKKDAATIDQPCLTLFGTAIPNHYYQALSERMLTNGLFARMLILECGQRSAGQEPTIRDLPASILETARWWVDLQSGSGNLNAWHPVPTMVQHTDEARDILIAARLEAEREYRKAESDNDSVGTTVWGRVSEHSRKLALLHAISENHLEPLIAADASRWAVRFVMHGTRRMLFMARTHVADNPFHAACLKLCHKLRAAPDGTLPHSVLLKRMKIDARTFQELVTTLEQQGDIVVEPNPTGGRPSKSYRLMASGEISPDRTDHLGVKEGEKR